MKVLFLTNVPAPYRVDFFNELGKLCDLTVLFEKSTSDERDDSWKQYQFSHFNGILLHGRKIGVDNAVCREVVKYLKKDLYDHIIVSDFLDPTGMIAIEYMRVRGIPYWLECDGGFAKDGKGFREALKTHFIRGAFGYFSTSDALDEYYIQYGAKPERIFRFPFTSLKESDILPSVPSTEKKCALRGKLAIKEANVVLAVGQFVYRKGFDVLLEAAVKMPQNTGVYIIGDNPTAEYLSFIQEHKLRNVHFVGFRLKEALKEYYQAADVFVLPTREDIWGLVINESMAYGLPVVTTQRCIAGLELVHNEVNGYIVPVDSSEKLREAVCRALEDKSKMGQESLKIIRSYTIENMARQHYNILSETDSD